MNSARKNHIKNRLFKYWGILCTFTGLVLLAIFIGNILLEGLGRIDWSFLTSLPSRRPERAGILTAMMGTIWILGFTAIADRPDLGYPGIWLTFEGNTQQQIHLLEFPQKAEIQKSRHQPGAHPAAR